MLEMIPFVVISFGIFATILVYRGIDSLHTLVFFLAVLALLLFKRHKVNLDSSILMSLFFFNICMVLISSILFSPKPEDIIVVLIRYFLPFSFGILLISSRVKISASYYDYWYFLLLAITFLAYLQYFFSPTLWSLIPTESSTLFAWSENQSFASYMLYFRGTSILGSPQVWAAFSALSILALTAFREKKIGPFVLAFLWFGAFLSGGKIAVLIFIMYTSYFLRARFINILYLATFILTGYFLYLFFFDFELPRIFEHVTGLSRILEEEEGGRLSIWAKITSDMNLFFGGGPSYINNLDSKTNLVAESYILQTWVELTIIFPLTFVYLIVRQVYYYRDSLIHIIFYGAVLASTISSHAFSHPVFFAIWPLLVSHCQNKPSGKIDKIKKGSLV